MTPRARPRKSRKATLLAALLAVCILLFVALGVWQIERRAEKLTLIEAVEERLRQPPASAPGPAEWLRIALASDAYRRLRVRGEFLHDGETLVQASTRLGPGYWVMTPLRTESGWLVLVNRGFVPPEDRDPIRRQAGAPRGQVTVTGLLRVSEPGRSFLHANDPAGDRWYSRDVAAIGSARRLDRLAPYFIDAAAGPDAPGQPVGGLTIVSFANNHLQYALTWFALAGLAALGLARIRRMQAPEP